MSPKLDKSKGQKSITSFIFTKKRPDTEAEAPPSSSGKKEDIDLSQKSKRFKQAPKTATNHPFPSPKPRPSRPSIHANERRRILQQKLVTGSHYNKNHHQQQPGTVARTQEALRHQLQASKTASKLTPLEQQVQALMKQHPDCLLAIEVGYKVKFYAEHAEIASKILNLGCYPDRNFVSLWIPVSRLAHHVRRLVEAGYKVGVVRQTETAALKKVGDNRNQPFKREVTEMYTRATIEAGGLAALEWSSGNGNGGGGGGGGGKMSGDNDGGDDGDDHRMTADKKGGGDDDDDHSLKPTITANAPLPSQEQYQSWSNERLSRHLVVLVEHVTTTNTSSSSIGLIAVEVSTGTILYDEFSDGPMREQLEKYLLMAPPSEVVLGVEVSSNTRRLIDHFMSGNNNSNSSNNGSRRKRDVATGTPTPTENTAATSYSCTVSATALPSKTKNNDSTSGLIIPEDWPPFQFKRLKGLPPMVQQAVLCARKYLQPLGLESALTLGDYKCYSSLHTNISLLPNALVQLEILKTHSPSGELSSTASSLEKGSLLWLLDRTLTPGGGRLMREWVTKPLKDRNDIEERQKAVEELMNSNSSPVLAALPGVLKSLPDLSRTIGRAFHATCTPPEFVTMLQTFANLPHQLKLVPTTEDGSDGLDIQENAAGTTSLRMLLRAAGNFTAATAANELLVCLNVQAAAAGDKLNMFVTPPHGDIDDEEMEDTQEETFDLEATTDQGYNNTNANTIYFPDVAEKKQALEHVKQALLDALPGFASKLKLKTLTYVSIQNQGDYMLEVPVDLTSRVPKDWERVCSTKKVVRYRPPEVKEWLGELGVAEEQLTLACNAAWRCFQQKFSKGSSHQLFTAAVTALSELDCLLSLANLASSQPGYVRPEFITTTTAKNGSEDCAELHIVGGRHPVLEVIMQGSHQYVPNDISLSTNSNNCRCMLITGPNMGGKSSISRSVALIALMAQIGSFVPAASCRMSVFDGIFTRFGASDNIALGRSTFMEELSEMGGILSKATNKSLVLVDELGRGTATQDGQAIAAATLQYLADKIGCLTLFITHYNEVAQNGHKLSRDEGAVRAWHMGYVEEEKKASRDGGHDDDDDDNDGLPHISFTYILKPGTAPASYGLNVARLAGVPTSVVKRADEVSSLEALQEAVAKVKRMQGRGVL